VQVRDGTVLGKFSFSILMLPIGEIIPAFLKRYSTCSNDGLQNNLVKWEEIGSLAQYRADIGYDYAQTNYALKLGDGFNEITHNRFFAPDWGVLRFDLHVPSEIRKVLKTKTFPTPNLNASLLATTDTTISSAFSPMGSNLNGAIRHDSITVESLMILNSFANRSSEVSVFKVHPSQNSSCQIGISQVSTTQISSGQVGITKVGTSQISSTKISTDQSSSSQIGSNQIDTTQVKITQSNVREISPSSIVAFNQLFNSNIGTEKSVNKLHVSNFYMPIQFLTFHNSFLRFFYTSPLTSIDISNSNSLNLWNTLFDPTNPLDITLQIEDLPTGKRSQLINNGFDPDEMLLQLLVGHSSHINTFKLM
jgi:hypothetical protein